MMMNGFRSACRMVNLSSLAGLFLVLGWGAQLMAGEHLTTSQLAASDKHALALRSDGSVWAWGTNQVGETGLTNSLALSPKRVSGLSNIMAIATGPLHSLAVQSNGSVWAWGANGDGRLGNGTTTTATAPVAVALITNAIAVSAGDSHSLALLADGRVASWGNNQSGRLGNGTTTATNRPVMVSGLSNVVSVVAGSHSMAITVGAEVWVWGYNSHGELGLGDVSSRTTATKITTLSNITQIAAGLYHSLARDAEGRVFAWGRNNGGQLGLGFSGTALSSTNQPAQIGGLVARWITAGGYNSAAVAMDGNLHCWGLSVATAPKQVGDDHRFTTATIGYGFALAMKERGFVWGWGLNTSGELGKGETTSNSYESANPIFSFAPSPYAQTVRFIRGDRTLPRYNTFLLPLDLERGVGLDADGRDQYAYGLATPWFLRIASTPVFHAHKLVGGTNFTRFKVENPVAAYGSSGGGSPLYVNQPYTLGLYIGAFDEDSGKTNVFRISVYNRSDFNGLGTDVAPVNVFEIALPRRSVAAESNAWINFATNGFLVTVETNGLRTTVGFVDGAATDKPWGLSWLSGPVVTNVVLAGYRVTHTATSTNYCYKIDGLGAVQASTTNMLPLATNSAGVWTHAPLYALDFETLPPWRSTFIDQPHFAGIPVPPEYAGRSEAELSGLTMAATNYVILTNDAAFTNLDTSPELLQHPILNQFVEDMGRDPLALASYVINEIGLTDPFAMADASPVKASINVGGVNRSALGVYLEGQGTPTEQCALLVYLLRKAGYSAAYAWPSNNNLRLLDTTISKLWQIQVKGVTYDNGIPIITNSLIVANYPWVVANIGTNCVHIFPWLKDHEIVEGPDLYDYMPTNYAAAYAWAKDYALGQPNLLDLDPESNLPLSLWPRFLETVVVTNQLNTRLSLDDFGVRAFNRRRHFPTWEHLPQPNFLTNQTQVAILRHLSESTVNYPFLTSIFNVIEVEVYKTSITGSNKAFDTGPWYACNWHNRKLLVYMDGETSLRLWMAPFVSGITNTSSFTGPYYSTNLLSEQATVAAGVEQLVVRVIHKRRVETHSPDYNYFTLKESGNSTIDVSCSKGDVAAVCFSFGKVTPAMLRVHAEEYWRLERERAINPNLAPSVADNQGTAAMLLGMGYFERLSKFSEINQRLHKVRGFHEFLAGLGVIGKVPNGAKMQAKVDMQSRVTTIIGNGSLRPDSGEDVYDALKHYLVLNIVNASAQEHDIINSTFNEQDAISTVRLLQLAAQRAATNAGWGRPLELNRHNYHALGEGTNWGYGPNKLKDQIPSVWQSVTNAFNSWDADFARVLITPGLVTNDSGTYKGMGALILNFASQSALISANSAVLNGGWGSQLPSFIPGPSTYEMAYSLVQTPKGNYGFNLNNSSLPTVLGDISPQRVLTWNTGAGAPEFLSTPFHNDLGNLSLSIFGDTMGNVPSWLKAGINFGNVGLTDASFLQKDSLAYDPVEVVTGGFYVDTVDLSLPGPLPLQLRRNYSSRNLAPNQFGYGWKMNFMPFLVVATNAATNVLIQAADPEGAVVMYRGTTTSNLWLVYPQDNPTLNNNTTAGVGATANRFNTRITRYTTNGVTYVLAMPDGSRRFYQQMDTFGLDAGTNHLDRIRPYLTRWEDHAGNYHLFRYGTNAMANDYGQVNRIDSGNGNSLVFQYDFFARITQAFTADGRRVKYDYDNSGDLVRVTLPDDSEWKYEYQHSLFTVTNALTNLALAGIASQSSTQWFTNNQTQQPVPGGEGVASKANDGSTNSAVINCTKTGNSSNEWWEVNLGTTAPIGRVHLWFRTTGNPERNDNLRIVIYDKADPGTRQALWTKYVGSNPPLNIAFDVAPAVTGQVVRVEHHDVAEHVQLAEVQVFKATEPYATHLLVRESKPDGRLLVNDYDQFRRVTRQAATVGTNLALVTNAWFFYTNNVDSLTNEFVTGTTRVEDVFHNPTLYSYTSNLITRIEVPGLRTSIQDWFEPGESNSPGYYRRSLQFTVDARGLTNEYRYDLSGNVTNLTLKGDLTGTGAGTDSVTTAFAYANNLPQSMVDGAGIRTAWFYEDAADVYRPTRIERAVGGTGLSTNRYSYTNVTSAVDMGYWFKTNRAYGLRSREVRADVATNEWVYDGRGFPIQAIRYARTAEDSNNLDPAVTVTFAYNARGEVYEQQDAAGRRTQFDYDAMGRPKWREVLDENGNVLSRETFYYNRNGELEWYDGPRSNPDDLVWYDHDGAGRKTEEIHWRSRAKPDGSGVEAESGDALYATTFYRYDGFGNLLTVTNPRGAMTTNAYDALGQLVQSKAYDTDGTTLLSGEGFAYEPGGKVRYHTNALTGVTETLYTSTGQPRFRRNADGSTNAWRYYADGRPATNFLGNSQYWFTTYDDAKRLVKRTFSDDAGNTETTVLDRRGNVVLTTNAVGAVFTNSYDGLDRLKVAVGPATVSGVSTQQITSYIYDASGSTLIVSNVLGEKTVSTSDALGRPVTMAVYAANGAMVSTNRTFYSPDHHSVTSVAGSGAGAIINTTFTDTFGKPVLAQRFPGSGGMQFTRAVYDIVGNLIASRDELNQISTFDYDGLNRAITNTLPDGAKTTFRYNAASSITNRTMPGNLVWSAAYDSANRLVSERETGGALTARVNTYDYYTTWPFMGLLQKVTDGRGVVRSNSYDSLQRLIAIDGYGTLPEHKQHVGYAYDRRGRIDIIDNYYEGAVFTGTTIWRGWDGYDRLVGDEVEGFSTLQIAWDGAGRRATLFSFLTNAATRTFGYRADGLMTSVTANGQTYHFNYSDNGLLTSRSNAFRVLTVGQRDGRGRLKQQTNTVGATTPLIETFNWRANSTLDDYTAVRGFTDLQDFSYNVRGQLTNDTLKPSASGATVNTGYGFDADKLGVLTAATQSGGLTNRWQSGPLDDLKRVQTGTNVIGGLSLRASGLAYGAASVTAVLDGNAVGVTYPANSNGVWFVDLNLTNGSHSLAATAHHPAGLFDPSVTNSFTVLGQEAVTQSYDGAGNVTNRAFADGRAQSLAWNAFGQLVKLTERNGAATNYTWTAVYDGLGRRVRTIHQPGGTNSTATLTLDSWFDPQVEFLEVAVAVNGARTWKIYGPDMSGSYGGMQGTGGLEATVRESDGVATGLLNDYFGHSLGTISGGVVNWSPTRVNGYGPVRGMQAPLLSASVSEAEAAIWRGHRIDPTGFYYLGARHYDPVAGRFLSADPFGHGASMDLYSAFNGDPVNYFDADGRLASGFAGGFSKGDFYQPGNFDHETGQFLGQIAGGITPVWGQIADLRDWTAAANAIKTDGLGWGTGIGMALATAAWVPGVGDAIKGFGKSVLRMFDDAPVSVIMPSHVNHPSNGGEFLDDSNFGGQPFSPGASGTSQDLYAFGNKSGPRSPRPFEDFGVESPKAVVGPESPPLPKGASTYGDVNQAPLTGDYHFLPTGTKLPNGLGVVADGVDVLPNSPHPPTHNTLFPTTSMAFEEFDELFQGLPWEHGGKKRKK